MVPPYEEGYQTEPGPGVSLPVARLAVARLEGVKAHAGAAETDARQPRRWRQILQLVLLLSGALWAHAADWDVIVVGSEPEAIAAAVAASEEGAKTLLVSLDPRLGGLFTRGALNVLDLRVTPFDFQLGIFDRWWRKTGRHHAFALDRAEGAFAQLLAEAGVEVRLGVASLEPHLTGRRVHGVVVDGTTLTALQVIDGSSDADLAAAAGARSSWGFQEVGLDARMADTLMIRIEGVWWSALQLGATLRGKDYAYVDNHVAYGAFAGYPAAYQPLEPGLRLRGLNLGRDSDGGVWMNALLIYGIDPFDPVSRAEGRERAIREAERIIDYLAEDIPGFARARFGGVADDFYVRQTRHVEAHCRLTIDDVLDHVTSDLDVAIGGYPLDVQTLQPSDTGFVFGLPDIYGGRLCMMVPRGIEGLWVVGRSAGYDPIAQSSARVVPFGMAMAEAAGVAAAWGAANWLDASDLAADPAAVATVRARLAARGAVIPAAAERTPAGPYQHPHYQAYRTLLRWGLAVGGYGNDPALDQLVSPSSLTFLLSNVAQRAFDDRVIGRALVDRFGLPAGDLNAPQAARLVGAFIAHFDPERPASWERAASWGDLVALGLPLGEPEGGLHRGETYALVAWVLERFGRTHPRPSYETLPPSAAR
jgi:hypothetical protein